MILNEEDEGMWVKTYEAVGKRKGTPKEVFNKDNHVRVYMIVSRTTNGNTGDVLKLKSFVYRTSRTVGGSTAPLAAGKIIS